MEAFFFVLNKGKTCIHNSVTIHKVFTECYKNIPWCQSEWQSKCQSNNTQVGINAVRVISIFSVVYEQTGPGKAGSFFRYALHYFAIFCCSDAGDTIISGIASAFTPKIWDSAILMPEILSSPALHQHLPPKNEILLFWCRRCSHLWHYLSILTVLKFLAYCDSLFWKQIGPVLMAKLDYL